MRRNHIRSIRFSDGELTAHEVRAAQAGMSFSTYVRAALGAYRAPPKADDLAEHDDARQAIARRRE